MGNKDESVAIMSAMVTDATGLLGKNLVRLLVSRGVQVKALLRSREKAKRQLAGLPVKIVVGKMTNVRGFAETLKGIGMVSHKGGSSATTSKEELTGRSDSLRVCWGTAHLFAEAYTTGVRRVVHTSAVGTLRRHHPLV